MLGTNQMSDRIRTVGRGRSTQTSLTSDLWVLTVLILICAVLVTGSVGPYPNAFSKVPYWLNENCNKSAITRHLLRVCVVYKRNAAYFLDGAVGSAGDDFYDLGPPDPWTLDMVVPPYPLVPPPPFPFLAPPPFFFYPFMRRPPFFPDPFKRWRRQARINEIIVKCCVSGCSSADFVEVDRQYNLCDK